MEFSDQLQKWCRTESGPYRRPFTPNVEWERAQILVVGTNPATPMRDQFESFGQYWAALTKEPNLFYSRYQAEHRGKSSKSTKVAKHFLTLLEPLNVLVTNVVWYPVERKRDIPKAEWSFGRQALSALIDYVKPKVVFCHGADAEDFARALDQSVDRYRPANEQATQGIGLLVLAYHHFSGQGLRKGAQFQPDRELPIFAETIHTHVCT